MTATATRPRLGFVGVGWIGRHRLDAVAASGVAEVAGVADPAVDGALRTLDELLEHDLDGIVIATPNAFHAEQAVAALERGIAVFCQKPLGRTAAEARRVVDAARTADRLLAVDFSYRFVEGARRIRELVAAAALGRIYAADLVFHNAYGPDKDWFYDRELAGGGCVIDLGTHLVDLALWTLGFPTVERVTARLLSHGGHAVEDYAEVRLDLAGGSAARIACSWNVPLPEDARIEARFYGTDGGATLRNVGGSFYDLVAERHVGGVTTTLAEPPDAWGGRGAVEWARRVGEGAGFDATVEEALVVADVVDRIYGAAS